MASISDSSSLDAQLHSFDADQEWIVLEELKHTDCESTQKVAKKDEEGNIIGPFIRKEFSYNSKQGQAYKKIWQEQQEGVFLKHCPKIIEYLEYACNRVVILEYIDGETLERHVKDNCLSEEQIKQLFLKICVAVDDLHTTFSRPLIHRDLKPTNIIVADEEVFIIDLSIARFKKGDLTPDTTQFGTPFFAPPEQYGYEETCVESDIYSLGMVLYFMLTKELSKVPLRDNASLDSKIPLEFKDVLLRSTSFDPKDRYQSVGELWSAVNYLKNTKDVSFRDSLGKVKRKFGTLWNVLIVAFWLLMTVGVFGAFLQPNDEMASRSFAYRTVGYIGIVAIPFTIFSFVALEKSRLKEKFAFFKKINSKTLFALSLIALFIMTISAIVVNFL